MTNTMKSFQFLQKSYKTIGFYTTTSERYNSKNYIMLLSIFQLCLSSFAFFCFQAESTFEYGASFYGFIITLLTVVGIVLKLSKMTNILALIEHLETFIAQSKPNFTHEL